MTIHSDYFKTTQTHQKTYGDKTVVLIQVGAFYEIYGVLNTKTKDISKSHLNAISKLCNLKIATKQHLNDEEELVMIGFRDYNLDKYIPMLTNEGWTVPVINQDAPTSNTTRSLFKIFSPGTTFLSDDKSITNNIMCIWMEKKFANSFVPYDMFVCGISTTDIYTGRSYIHEYHLKQFKHITSSYDELERFYSTYKPKEILFVYKNFQDSEVDDVIKFLNIYVPVRKVAYDNDTVKLCEKQTYQCKQFEQFYKFVDYEDFCERTMLNEFEIAKQSFCYLLDSIFIQNKELVRHIAEPIVFSHSNNIILANHSLLQLNMINAGSDYTGKLASVVDFVMSYCATSMGKRQLKHQLLNPINKKELLEERYATVAYVKERTDVFSPIFNKMKSLFDIEKFYRKIVIKKIMPSDFVSLHNNIELVKDIYLDISQDPYFNKVNEKYNIISCCDTILDLLKNTFNFEKCSYSLDTNIFCSGFSDAIDTLEQNMIEDEEKLRVIRTFFESVIGKHEKKTKYNLVEIHRTEKSGLFIQTTKRRCAILKSNLAALKKSEVLLSLSDGRTFMFKIDNLQYVQSGSNKQRIDNMMIRQITQEIERTNRKLVDEVQREFIAFVEGFTRYETEISSIIQFVINTDVHLSLGIMAKQNNYCCPVIDQKDTSFVKAQQMRHILIEQLHQNETYVANDVELSDETRGILLFGTNAVGKSSLIKALGICVIMAQAGLFVPCNAFTFSPYSSIFTRILGNDNIFKGLSSFAVEMIELNTILKLANKNSLVLGDELCSGTETTSAICIFSSGIIQLQERTTSFIFATHFHEICKLKKITSLNNVVMKHMKVIYDRENDKLVYNRILSDGPGMNEYGLEVCKSLSMPDDFITMAYGLKQELKKEYGGILSKKTSRYNSKKVKGICEMCKKEEGVDTHHLLYQCSADEDGFINTFHKDHVANLINVCKDCHTKIHQKNQQFKRTKTSDGYELVPV